MNKEKQTVHEFDLNIIRDYFLNFERQGPGNPELTLQALGFVDNLTENSLIADIGCGTGGQTIVLGQTTLGKITGIDLCSKYIKKLNNNAKQLNLQNKVNGIVGSMDKLPFGEEELDLIWCEGAIYNIGFRRGLHEWRKFLKQGGYIVVSENTWFTEERPAEIQEFWQKAYPEIDTIPNKVAQMHIAGYVPIASFVMPDTCWTDYYSIMQKAEKAFLKTHKGNKTAEEFVGYQQYEAELYYKYKAHYGLVFYIGKKI